jgi:hypothetical protein
MRTESAPKNLTAKRSTLLTGPGSYGASAFCYHPIGAGRGSVKDPLYSVLGPLLTSPPGRGLSCSR